VPVSTTRRCPPTQLARRKWSAVPGVPNGGPAVVQPDRAGPTGVAPEEHGGAATAVCPPAGPTSSRHPGGGNPGHAAPIRWRRHRSCREPDWRSNLREVRLRSISACHDGWNGTGTSTWRPSLDRGIPYACVKRYSCDNSRYVCQGGIVEGEPGVQRTPHPTDRSSETANQGSEATNGAGDAPTGPQHVDRDEELFSNLAKLWLEGRDTVESFANKYFSPANREKPVTTSEWLQDSLSLGARMSSLWLKGIGLLVEESGRLARRTEGQQAKADGSDTTRS
jgi:hypothetical protein